MRVLIVYESMFGNTATVALAIAEGLRQGQAESVQAVEIGAAPHSVPDDVDLLIVGGPTHAHGMTTPKTRADSTARANGNVVSPGIGVREWLDALASPARRTGAVAFDTRIKGPELLWGSAAKAADKRLRALGFDVAKPVSFLVAGPTGPLTNRLLDREADRARTWGARLASNPAAPVA